MQSVQDVKVYGALPRNASPHSHSSDPSDSSDTSVSTSTSHELLAAQYDSAVQSVLSSHAPRPGHRGRGGQKSSPCPRGMQQSQQVVRNPASQASKGSYQLCPSIRPMASSQRSSYGSSGSRQDKSAEWHSWEELRILVFGLPSNATTQEVALWFRQEGKIRYIELYENCAGLRNGKACLSFLPPPARAFWKRNPYHLRLEDKEVGTCRLGTPERSRRFSHPSPVRPNVSYPEMMLIKAESLDFGMVLDENTVLGKKQVTSMAETTITFQQNMHHRELNIEFRLPIRDWRSPKPGAVIPKVGRLNREEDFKFSIAFTDLSEIRESAHGHDCFALFITSEIPPSFFKRVDDLQSHDDCSRMWNDKDAWYRQTDVVYNPLSLKRQPLTLKNTHAILDLGRWITYRLIFNRSRTDMGVFRKMCNALQDYNVNVVPCPGLDLVTGGRSAVWEHIDKPIQQGYQLGGALHELMQADQVPYLAFRVRYQLEVCISHGYFNEYCLDRGFVQKLAAMEPSTAQGLLEHVANQKKRILRPMSIFDLKAISGTTLSAKIPDYCVLVRSVTVTPTTIYFHTPTVETSNRVIRQYSDHADRFLRARFTDERPESKIFSTDKGTMNEVFARIKRAMSNGIQIGDRRYEFLAFGNSQLREHGAYFFAPTSNINAKRIRMWMGSFEEIKTVAKYASRLGQCFSTTRAIASVTPHIKELDDIHHNGFNFTDGVGRISPFLAQLAASDLGILQANQETPSVFQFRLGGCKGVLAISPRSAPRELHLRRSQYKFPASHEGLEIIRWSQYACAKLNRQLILVLSTLGVRDEVFRRKLQIQLQDLKQAMTDPKKSLTLLQKYVDHNQMTLTLASMVIDGFQSSGEPFMLAVLQLWRAWSLKYLKEKAQIAVDGALLLGCVDETNTLQGHYNEMHRNMPGPEASMEEKCRHLPQIFVQLSRDPENKESSKSRIILGPVLLTRSPLLHPGDIRVVCGVDVPELHHIKDAVVLPQNGDRDIASMCSGGDLDGDDFLVIWDQDLLPKEWNHEPMDYSQPPPLIHGNEITVDDLTTFFVRYIKNDCLGSIATSHVAWADYSDQGVKDERCLKLAQLHSEAVDFAKTGQPARMTRDLRPRKEPHFLAEKKKKKREDQIYPSRKVLGQLYDQIEKIDFSPTFLGPFDRRILNAYDIPSPVLAAARQIKQEYDAAIRRVMAKLEIKTEFEVWSNFVLAHNKPNGDFKFHEEIGQVSGALKCQFRDMCIEAAGGKDFDQLGHFVAAMYQVTAEDITAAREECDQTMRQIEPTSMPLMSFPWIFQEVLGKIAKLSSNPFSISSTSTEVLAKNVVQTQSITGDPRKGRGVADAPDLETAQGAIRQGDIFKPFASQYMKDLEALGDGIRAHSHGTRSPTLSSSEQSRNPIESVTPLDSELKQLTSGTDGQFHLPGESSGLNAILVDRVSSNAFTGNLHLEEHNEAASDAESEGEIFIDYGTKSTIRKFLEAFGQNTVDEEQQEYE